MGTGLESPTHLLILAIIALLIFGPKRMPELGRGLGEGLRGFRRGISGEHDEPARPEPLPVAAPTDVPPRPRGESEHP
jgi:sec-independent protein translocase protein TatA